MWEFTLRESDKNNEKNFFFDKGHFIDEKAVIRFANGACLKMVLINQSGNKTPLYIEPLASLQLTIFDGNEFLFKTMYKRLFQNFSDTQKVMQILQDKDFTQEEEQVLLKSSILFIASTLGAYLKDMIEIFCTNRYKEIPNGAKSVYKFKYEQSLKRFNNPSPKNLKEILKDLNLFPEVLQSIDLSKMDDLYKLRNKIAHGGELTQELTIEDVDLYLNMATDWMSEISSKLYRKMSYEGELDSWPHVRGSSEKIDKVWTLMPLLSHS
jgi:hypothetical protein